MSGGGGGSPVGCRTTGRLEIKKKRKSKKREIGVRGFTKV